MIQNRNNSIICLIGVLAFNLLMAPPTRAQVVGATLSGTVKDQSGAVIPNAQISITNVATGVSRNIVTYAAGFYTAPDLLPGIYDITVSASGFATQAQTGVNLEVGAQQVLNMTMTIGQVTGTVQVTGEAPTVELASSTISAVVNSTTIKELPLNGRSWTDLAALQPGVSAVQTQMSFDVGSARGNRGFGNQITVAGARPQQNNYRLDGISINDYANGGPGSVLGGNLGVDAIQEFSVLTSNYSTEYGRTAGGVVNAITRSGTNQFHGSVYEFLRNSALDARNFFDGPNIPPFKRNQFGASAGAPIRKDKVFVFADYEGIRQSKGITTVDTVPSAAARGGTLCSTPDTTSACTPTTIGIDPLVQKYLPFWPLPNGGIKPGTNGDIGIFAFAGQQVINENFFTTRVDDKFSNKDNLTATYLQDVTPYSSPDSLRDVLINSETNRHVAILEETHTFGPTLVNSARIGYNRAAVLNNAGVSAINPLAADPSLAAVPGQFASSVVVSGLTRFLGGVQGSTLNTYFWNSFQGYDDASWTHGTHFVRFGGAVERMDLNYSILESRSGVFTFSTLSNFLSNKPSRFALGFPGHLTPRGLRQTIFGVYIQDDWRARSNLTVNMGLRWEMTTVPSEVHGELANLINITDPAPHLGSPFFSNPTLRNFEPRVGFAWDPFRSGKTAVRAGFGVFDVLPLPVEFFFRVATAAPFALLGQVNKLTPGSFYTGAFSQAGPASSRETYIEQHPHRSYVMQWNFSVQRELAPSLTALVAYAGSRGVHQPFTADDLNIVLPISTPQGWLFPAPVGSGTTINPNFGQIAGVLYRADSSYNALEVGVEKRITRGIQFQSSFTWGKSLDTGSATLAGDQFSNSLSSLPWYDPKSFRGLSDFNVARTLVISGTWQVPSAKSSGPAAWITNGWQLGVIYKVTDGTPFTATFGTDGDPQGLNSSDPWAFPSRLTGPGCKSLVNPGNPINYIKTQCFAVPTAPSPAFYTANCDTTLGVFPQCFNLRGNSGRNILIGPGLSNLDFSVFKNNYVRKIAENFNVQFRAEFFNILNRSNFAPPVTPNNTDIFDSTGAATGVAGLLTSTTTTAREIQFALKVSW
jgi:hypothetical protein